MSGSISESDGCSSEWDDTWKPPSGEENGNNCSFSWTVPWKRFGLRVQLPTNEEIDIPLEFSGLSPVKIQFLASYFTERLQAMIFDIPNFQVKGINIAQETIEVSLKSTPPVDPVTEIINLLTNETEELFLKTIRKLPYTCKVAEGLSKNALQEKKVMLLRDDKNVYFVGLYEARQFINTTIDRINSASLTNRIQLKHRGEAVALNTFGITDSLCMLFPDIVISAEEESDSVVLFGIKEDVGKATDELEKKLETIYFSDLQIHPLILKLLTCSLAQQIFDTSVKDCKMQCVWSVEKQKLNIFSMTVINKSVIKACITENFLCTGFPVSNAEEAQFYKSRVFEDTVKQHKDTLLVIEQTERSVSVASSKSIVLGLLNQEKMFNGSFCREKETQVNTIEVEICSMKTANDDLLKKVVEADEKAKTAEEEVAMTVKMLKESEKSRDQMRKEIDELNRKVIVKIKERDDISKTAEDLRGTLKRNEEERLELNRALEDYKARLLAAEEKLKLFVGSSKETVNIRRNRRFGDITDNCTPLLKGDGQDINVSSQTLSTKSRSGDTSIPMDQVYATNEGISVKVYVGNILKLDVECIVNATNENLQHGGGVAAVISRAAGYQFDQESRDYVIQNGTLPVGTCCSTSAGNLPYKYVIHTVGPRWQDYKFDEKRFCAADLKQSIICTFEEAETLQLKSIALPSISAGIFGVPKDICAQQYAHAVAEFSKSRKNRTCLREIHFIDKDIALISFIQNEFNKFFQQSAGSGPGQQTKSNINDTNRRSFQRSMSTGSESENFPRSLSSGSESENPSTTVVNRGRRDNRFKGSVKKSALFQVKDVFKVEVKMGDITKLQVDAIVCPQDEFQIYKGANAREIEKIAGSDYQTKLMKMPGLKKNGAYKSLAPRHCLWRYIIQAVPPRWNLEVSRDNQKFMNDMKETVTSILKTCVYSNIKSLAVPLMGTGEKGMDTPVVTFAEQFIKALMKIIDEKKADFSLEEIQIVVNDVGTVTTIIDSFSLAENLGIKRLGQSGQKSPKNLSEEPMEVANAVEKNIEGDCCICLDELDNPRKLPCGHIYCTECIREHFKYKPSCPECGTIHEIITGNQPKGNMTIKVKNFSLCGYEDCNTIEIQYIIYSGIQGQEHPTPGVRFDGISRTAFLPHNKKGRQICKLLEIAFKRRLIFTIGTSITTGKSGVVIWNDIHHKTNSKPHTQFGYPDDDYLDRVLEELAGKGVSEKDLKE